MAILDIYAGRQAGRQAGIPDEIFHNQMNFCTLHQTSAVNATNSFIGKECMVW